MKTVLLITIEHTKPLPDKVPVTDIAAQRLYGYFFANGVEVDVEAQIQPQVPDEVKPC